MTFKSLRRHKIKRARERQREESDLIKTVSSPGQTVGLHDETLRPKPILFVQTNLDEVLGEHVLAVRVGVPGPVGGRNLENKGDKLSLGSG